MKETKTKWFEAPDFLRSLLERIERKKRRDLSSGVFLKKSLEISGRGKKEFLKKFLGKK